MLTRKNLQISGVMLFSAFLLRNFQNCSPAHPGSSGASSTTGTSSGGQAHLIEDFNKAEIQFATAQVQLHDELAAADVGGLCNSAHNGAALKWTIWSSTGAVLASGQGSCGSGQFDLHLTGLEQMACGVNHQLVVEADWGGSTNVVIQQRCQPLASEDIAASNAPAGTECALEYVPAGEGQSPCSQACYRQGQLMSQVAVDVKQCSGMISQLAGQ